MKLPPWPVARSLLCVNFGGLGELLACTPAIRALRDCGPEGRRVTMLCSKRGAAVARHVPEVAAVVPYEAPWLGGEVPAERAADLGMRYALQMRSFDAAVILTAPGESPQPAATLCSRARIPLRLGYLGTMGRPDLTHVVPAGAPGGGEAHEARRHLGLVAAVGARAEDERISFQVRSPASWSARLKIEEAGLDPRRSCITLHPGGGGQDRWPAAKLAAVARELSTVLDTQVVVVGGAAQRALAEEVRRGAGDRARSLAGSLTLEELAAVVERSSIIVCNDADAVQLASAVGTPVVDLLGSPRFAPWMVAHRVVRDNTPQAAVAATCDLWLDLHWRVAA